MSDFRFQRIPNYITVPSAVIALVFNMAAGMFGSPEYCGLAGLLASLAGFALGMALLFLPFAMGGGGAGDVKFLAAMCWALGWDPGIYFSPLFWEWFWRCLPDFTNGR